MSADAPTANEDADLARQCNDADDMVLDFITRPAERPRVDYLEITSDLAGPQSIILLWLLDREKHEFRLDRYHPMRDGTAPKALCDRSVVVPQSVLESAESEPQLAGPLHALLIDPADPAILEWLHARGHRDKPLIFELKFTNRAGQHTILGCVQLFVAEAIEPNKRRRIVSVMNALAGAIVSGRIRRKLSALQQMQEQTDLTKPIVNGFTQAARTLREVAKAEMCLVFQMERDLSLKAVAGVDDGYDGSISQYSAKEGSATHEIAKHRRKIRIADFHDQADRTAALGIDKYDRELVKLIESHLPTHPLRAWMVEPVVIKEHSMAVIMLLNKRESLNRQFSETDSEILHQICLFLAGVIPSVETYRAMVRLSEGVSHGLLENDAGRAQFYDMLADLIPGVTVAALVLQTPTEQKPEIIHLGGDQNWLAPAGPSTRPTEAVMPIKARGSPPSGAERFEFAMSIRGLPNHRIAILSIGLARSYLTDYEQQELVFLSANLSVVLRARDNARQQLDHTVQIRHAIRAGLTGVIGNVDVAAKLYEAIRDNAGTEEFDRAGLRKALVRAQEFSMKTQAIMEQSRFLLGTVTRQSLRRNIQSLRQIVNEVVQGLKSYADKRGLEVKTQHSLDNQTDRIDCDRELMEMVIFNLIENAIKYSYRNNQVLIETFLEKPDLVLEVTNNGIYIEPQDLNVIFEKFVRRPTGAAAHSRIGTGLGLAVAKEIVTIHGGTISARSDLQRSADAGQEQLAKTVFCVRMPR